MIRLKCFFLTLLLFAFDNLEAVIVRPYVLNIDLYIRKKELNQILLYAKCHPKTSNIILKSFLFSRPTFFFFMKLLSFQSSHAHSSNDISFIYHIHTTLSILWATIYYNIIHRYIHINGIYIGWISIIEVRFKKIDHFPHNVAHETTIGKHLYP